MTVEPLINAIARFMSQSKGRFVALLVALALVFGLASGGKHLFFSTNYRVFFGDDNPQLQAFESLQDVYNKDDNVLLVIEPKSGVTVFTPETIKALHDLTEESWTIDFSTRVDSITNFQHTSADGDDLTVAALYDSDTELTPERLGLIRRVATKEPSLVHRLVNPEGTVAAVNVTMEFPGKDPNEMTQVAEQVREEIVKPWQAKYPGYHVYLTGMVMMNNAFPESANIDMSTLMPLMLLLIVVTILFSTRSIVGTVVTLIVIALSVVSGMGFGGYMGYPLTPVSMTAVYVIMTLAVADSIHILISFREGMAKGLTKAHAINESLRQNFMPVFLTSITTAIGFLSLNASDVPPYQHYGNISAVGVLMAFVLSVVLLPCLLAVLPTMIKPKTNQGTGRLHRFAEMIIRKRRMLLPVSVIVAVLITGGISRIELNDKFVEYFGTEMQFRQDTDRVMEKLSGIYNISFDLKSRDTITEPAFIKKLEEFTTYLRAQDDVVHVQSLLDVYKRINRSMNGDNNDFYRIPEDQELAAQYLLLYKLSLPNGMDLNNQINLDDTATKLTITVANISTHRMRTMETDFNQWIVDNGEGVMTGLASSPTVMFSHISERNINSMISGTVIALVLITLVLTISLKSLRYGIVSLIPNLLPIAMAFGMWGILVGQIGMAVATIAGLTMGIVVDDTVHFMSKYIRGRRDQGMTSEQAIVYAFDTVGRALLATSVILVMGFIVMAQSSFRMNWSMGLLSSITIALALITDFFLLPPLLMAWDKWLNKGKSSVNSSTPSPSLGVSHESHA